MLELRLNLAPNKEASRPVRLIILQGDIIQQQVDAIVNPTDEILSGGGGLDAIIHQAAGPRLRAACNEVRSCKTGEAIITPGFDLAAKYVIHAVGPVYIDGEHNEPELLARCYRSILALARKNNLASIAIPAISTGVFKYPCEEAAQVVHSTLVQDLTENGCGSLHEIKLILWEQEKFNIYKKVFSS